MTTYLYRIYDETCERSSAVFEASNDKLAKEAFLAMYPVDSVSEYSLYRIAEFSVNGLLVVDNTSSLLIKGIERDIEDEKNV